MADPFSVEAYYSKAAQTGAEVLTAGYSVAGRPILVLRRRGEPQGVTILFVARIHGNEPAPTQAVLDLFSQHSATRATLVAVLLANPDGAALYHTLWQERPEPSWRNAFQEARVNAAGVDLNRDWFKLSQPETLALQRFIFSLRPQFVIDHHEFYWKDGYPPKYPTEDPDGFLATLTDCPFTLASQDVQEISEQVMNHLLARLPERQGWRIVPRHFVGESRDGYDDPAFLGVYLALRGIPKLLVETWGVGCALLLLSERVAFHRSAMELAIQWVEEHQAELKLEDRFTDLALDVAGVPASTTQDLKNTLARHGIRFEIDRDKLRGRVLTREIGFVKTAYHLIVKREASSS